jgi:hypothetical protein
MNRGSIRPGGAATPSAASRVRRMSRAGESYFRNPIEFKEGVAMADMLGLNDIAKRLKLADATSVRRFTNSLPADILGQVYEQFLGKVIRLTEGHRAVVEEKPEVKKAGGVYYTPTYIVDYIVKHTVGKLLGSPSPSPLGGEGRGEG